MIYTINNDVLTIVKDLFNLNDQGVYDEINNEFLRCKQVLKNKNIKYEDLQKALIPTKDLFYREYAFWLDINLIENSFYGREIMTHMLPAMDKKSTYSVLTGDYIDILNTDNSSEMLLNLMREQIHVVNESGEISCNQYTVVYFNRLTDSQFKSILNALRPKKWFYGYTELFDSSKLKSYLSLILVNKFIKYKDIIILPNPDDIMDGEANVNIHGYQYEENGYKIRSINEEAFYTFLSYKIETVLLGHEDSAYSINAIYPRFQYMKELEFEIPDDKWMYLNRKTVSNVQGKGEIMDALADELKKQEAFKSYIQNNLCNNYIYKLEKNEFGVLKFCECIGLRTQNGHYRKTLISFKYFPVERKLSLITIT